MKWVIAVDGSEHSLRATTYACTLAQSIPNIELEIVSVDLADQKRSEVLFQQETAESQELALQIYFEPYLKIVSSYGLTATTQMLAGSPKKVLRDYMNNGNGDHLFIGSRGLNGFQEFVLGSVSHSLMKHVVVPVTLVK